MPSMSMTLSLKRLAFRKSKPLVSRKTRVSIKDRINSNSLLFLATLNSSSSIHLSTNSNSQFICPILPKTNISKCLSKMGTGISMELHPSSQTMGSNKVLQETSTQEVVSTRVPLTSEEELKM